MHDDDLQVLLHTYQTARELIATKENALQQVLAWGAGLLIGATAIALTVMKASGPAPWAAIPAWALLVLVSAATAFQYAGESANMARLGAYAHRVECVIKSHVPAAGVPLYEHWSLGTQHLIAPQIALSGVAWVLLGVGAQGMPFLFGGVAGGAPGVVTYWPLLWVLGILMSLVVPGLYGWRSTLHYRNALAADGWDAAAAAKRPNKK